MEFAEDIAIGKFSSDELGELNEQGEGAGQSRQKENSLFGLPLSISISAIMHLTLGAALLYLVDAGSSRPEETGLSTIQIEFVSRNPLEVVADEALAFAAPEEADPAPLEEPEPSSLPEENPELPINPVETSQSSAEELAERALSEDLAAPEAAVILPTSDSVRRALSTLQDQDASRFYSYDCNKLEEESEFNDCAPSDQRDYSSLTRNPIYDYHNPAVEISRSRETFTTVARQSKGIAEQLALNNLPAGVSAYVLEELEQGIETYSNNSSRTLDHINTMTDKSAAGEMARRISTPWVRQQSLILQARKIESRTDSQFRERCKSYEKFIMNPAQFGRCISIGESPLGFVVEF